MTCSKFSEQLKRHFTIKPVVLYIFSVGNHVIRNRKFIYFFFLSSLAENMKSKILISNAVSSTLERGAVEVFKIHSPCFEYFWFSF